MGVNNEYVIGQKPKDVKRPNTLCMYYVLIKLWCSLSTWFDSPFTLLRNGARPAWIPVLVNFFQDRDISVVVNIINPSSSTECFPIFDGS